MQAALLVLAYLCGSIPFGLIATRLLANRDVRQSGSGNIGATNVARVAGKKVGALVLVLDAGKGALPVWLALSLSPDAQFFHAAVAVSAFVGHVFPLWLKFRGGKGVATALGVLVVLVPLAALVGLSLWAVIVATIRVSSVGSIAGGVGAIVAAFYASSTPTYAWLVVTLFAAMLWTHRENLGRLWARTERRI